MDLSLLIQFWVLAVLLALTPGADWAYAIAAGVRGRSIGPPIAGLLTGYLALVAIIAVGVGALVSQYPVSLTVLTLVGGVYLVWLGVRTLSAPVTDAPAEVMTVRGQSWAAFLGGASVSGLNPKGLLLLLALLPQFVRPWGWPEPAQMVTLGALHVLNCAVIYTVVALLARRALRAHPGLTKIVTKLAGGAMTVVGVALLGELVVGAL
jgi:threonine/homoserine/homoserine lactone efflux protein